MRDAPDSMLVVRVALGLEWRVCVDGLNSALNMGHALAVLGAHFVTGNLTFESHLQARYVESIHTKAWGTEFGAALQFSRYVHLFSVHR